jgi:hypothetical protein
MPRKIVQTNYPDARIAATAMPLEQATGCIVRTWSNPAVATPEELAPLTITAAHILRTAGELGATSSADLVGPLARETIALVAGVPQLGATLTREQRETARTARNTMFALHATLALDVAQDAADDPATPGEDAAVVCDLPKALFPRRPGQRCSQPRPWTIDEILLARLHFLTDTRKTSLRPGIAYALLEAGATPRDASAALDEDLLDASDTSVAVGGHLLDKLDTITAVRVGARAHRGERRLSLTGFGAALIARNLRLIHQARLMGPDRLTFTGADPGTGMAGMSVQGYLNDHAARAGIEDSETNIAGVAYWRQLQLLRSKGLEAALDCAFGPASTFSARQRLDQVDRLLTRLHISHDEAMRSLPWGLA